MNPNAGGTSLTTYCEKKTIRIKGCLLQPAKEPGNVSQAYKCWATHGTASTGSKVSTGKAVHIRDDARPAWIDRPLRHRGLRFRLD